MCSVVLFVLKCKIVEIVINVKVMVFWDVTPCSLVGMQQHSRAPCCFFLQGRSGMVDTAGCLECITLHTWRLQRKCSVFPVYAMKTCGGVDI